MDRSGVRPASRGRFVAYTINPDFDPRGPNTTKYGYSMQIPEATEEGVARFGRPFWRSYLSNPDGVVLSCSRPA